MAHSKLCFDACCQEKTNKEEREMKKRLALLLAIMMVVFALVSCGAPAASEAPETSGEA